MTVAYVKYDFRLSKPVIGCVMCDTLWHRHQSICEIEITVHRFRLETIYANKQILKKSRTRQEIILLISNLMSNELNEPVNEMERIIRIRYDHDLAKYELNR